VIRVHSRRFAAGSRVSWWLHVGGVLAIRADALALGKVAPHQLVLVHNDRHLAVNPQQHQQVRGGNEIGKMEWHGILLESVGLTAKIKAARRLPLITISDYFCASGPMALLPFAAAPELHF
jgi:hypothetical protein